MERTLNSPVPNTDRIEGSWFSFKFSELTNRGYKEKKRDLVIEEW